MTRVLSVLALLIGQTSLQSGPSHPLNGHWVADVSASRFNGAVSVKSTTLDVLIRPDAVTITSPTIDTNGRELVSGPTTFETDAQPHSHDELLRGLVAVCQCGSPQLLDTVLTRPNRIVDHVTYELSADLQKLTVKTQGPLGTQQIVFGRQ